MIAAPAGTGNGTRPGSDVDPQLIEIPVPESPTVALRIVIETGSVDDPDGKLGLCNLAMRAAAEGGTASLTKTQVADLLYPMAASIDVHVDRETDRLQRAGA